MSRSAANFVEGVRRRLALCGAVGQAARVAVVLAVPAAASCGVAIWLGWPGIGLWAIAGVVTGGAIGWAWGWADAPRDAVAAVAADRALGLRGLLSATTGCSPQRPAPKGFAVALASRADAAIAARAPSEVVQPTRLLWRPALLAASALVAVGGLALVPVAGAQARDDAARARHEHGAALLEWAGANGGDRDLADAIARVGRHLAAPEPGGVPAAGAGAGGGEWRDDAEAATAIDEAERVVRRRERRAQASRDALDAIAQAEAAAAAGHTADADAALDRAVATAPDLTSRTALERARAASADPAARASALDAAVAELTVAAGGADPLAFAELAARLRQARTALRPSATGGGGAARDGATTGGAGRAPVAAPGAAPAASLEALLRTLAPRVLERPTWSPDDDAVVRRYFGTVRAPAGSIRGTQTGSGR